MEPTGNPDTQLLLPSAGVDQPGVLPASGGPAELLQALSIREVDSACPVVIALPSALAPDPLVIRTLDTLCFESKTNSFETAAECTD